MCISSVSYKQQKNKAIVANHIKTKERRVAFRKNLWETYLLFLTIKR